MPTPHLVREIRTLRSPTNACSGSQSTGGRAYSRVGNFKSLILGEVHGPSGEKTSDSDWP
jgi:hypothetical protein